MMQQQQDEKAEQTTITALDFNNLTHETLAGYLLQSSDPKVQSAAKRIFSIGLEDTDADQQCSHLQGPSKKIKADEAGNPSTTTKATTVLSTMANAAAVAEQLATRTATTQSQQKFPQQPRSGCTIADLIACTASTKEANGKSVGYDKVQRRERNRMHARKTRQRKKEHMSNLQQRAEELKREQIRLRQLINEQNTATILLVLFGKQKSNDSGDNASKQISTIDSSDNVFVSESGNNQVENLLRRPVNEIPDSSQVPELPALVYNSNSMPASASLPNDGIDYQLLSKDRSKCTPEELDRIRKERNRMHAKRTRDRKRLFMEEMEAIIKTLEEENRILYEHHQALKGKKCSPQSPTVGSSVQCPNPVSAASTVTSTGSSGVSLCGDNDHIREEASHQIPCTSNGCTPLKEQRINGSKGEKTQKICSSMERKVSDVDTTVPKYVPPKQ